MPPTSLTVEPTARNAKAREATAALGGNGLTVFTWMSDAAVTADFHYRLPHAVRAPFRITLRFRILEGSVPLHRVYIGWMDDNTYHRIPIKHIMVGNVIEIDLKNDDLIMLMNNEWNRNTRIDSDIVVAFHHRDEGICQAELSEVTVDSNPPGIVLDFDHLKILAVQIPQQLGKLVNRVALNSDFYLNPDSSKRIRQENLVTLPGSHLVELTLFGEPKSPLEAFESRYAFHSWIHIRSLLWGFDHFSDPEYLVMARRFALKWLETNLDNRPSDEKYAYYDHGTAERLLVLIRLWYELILCDANIREVMVVSKAIQLHARLLYCHGFTAYHQDVFYHNHAVFQALALYVAGVTTATALGDADWRLTGLRNLAEQFKGLTSDDGVVIENSPGYHLAIKILLSTLLESVTQFEGSVPAELSGLQAQLNRMEDFVTALAGASRIMPPIGDTQRYPNSTSFTQSTDSRQFIIHDFHRSGYLVLRTEVPTALGTAEMDITFHATSTTATHKHDDDLSVILRIGGIEWIGDPGYPGYNEEAGLVYARSCSAHNTLDLRFPYQFQVGVSGLEPPRLGPGSTSALLSGRHNCFSGWTVRRHIFWDAAELLFLLVDEATADGPGQDVTPIIRFHCSEGIEADPIPDGLALRCGEVLGPVFMPIGYNFLPAGSDDSQGLMFLARQPLPARVFAASFGPVADQLIIKTAIVTDGETNHDILAARIQRASQRYQAILSEAEGIVTPLAPRQSTVVSIE